MGLFLLSEKNALDAFKNASNFYLGFFFSNWTNVCLYVLEIFICPQMIKISETLAYTLKLIYIYIPLFIITLSYKEYFHTQNSDHTNNYIESIITFLFIT